MNEGILSSFRNDRYERLNQCRWEQFLSMGIDIKGKTIFEPGAGVGDQTEWLLKQGVGHVYVNDGREENLEMVQERFGGNDRVTILPAQDMETAKFSDIPFVDLIFCWGVYYHLREDLEFRVLHQLSRKGATIVMDYLAGNDNEVSYGYDNPSTSLSKYAFRPRTETLMEAMTKSFGYAYHPVHQLKWEDPLAAETRLVVVGSHFLLGNPNLIRFERVLT